MSKLKLKELLVPETWSLLFFILPIWAAFYYSLYFFAGLLILSFISSVLFHLADEKSFYLIDRLLATLIILVNFVLCATGGFGPAKYFWIVIVFVYLAIHFYMKDDIKNYSFDHTLWHIFGALITYFSILTFVF